MRKAFAFFVVLLFCFVGFVQGGDEGILDNTEELNIEQVSEFNLQVEHIFALAEMFPPDERPRVAKAIALGLGLVVEDTENGCVRISEEELPAPDPSLSEGGGGGVPCNWSFCDHSFPASCFSNCDLGNYAVICSRGMSACCGCTVSYPSYGCGGCYWM